MLEWLCCHEQPHKEDLEIEAVRAVPVVKGERAKITSVYSCGIDLNKPLPKTPEQSTVDLVPSQRENWPLLDRIIAPGEKALRNPHETATRVSLSRDFVLNSPKKKRARFSLPSDFLLDEPDYNALGIQEELGPYHPSRYFDRQNSQGNRSSTDSSSEESIHSGIFTNKSLANSSPGSKFERYLPGGQEPSTHPSADDLFSHPITPGSFGTKPKDSSANKINKFEVSPILPRTQHVSFNVPTSTEIESEVFWDPGKSSAASSIFSSVAADVELK